MFLFGVSISKYLGGILDQMFWIGSEPQESSFSCSAAVVSVLICLFVVAQP